MIRITIEDDNQTAIIEVKEHGDHISYYVNAMRDALRGVGFDEVDDYISYADED